MGEMMSVEKVRGLALRLGVQPNWGRWGPEDQLGTLNLLTGENVIRARDTVQEGVQISLGRDLNIEEPPYYPQALDAAFKHEMITTSASNAGGDVQAASDQIYLQCHGLDTTHIDALCHIGYGGIGYNGRRFSEIVSSTGAMECDMLATGPIVTRAVLVDLPRLRGISHVPPGEAITGDELRANTPEVEVGDALIIRTGRALAPPEGRSATQKYGKIAGLHHNAMGFIAEKDLSLLAMDGSADTFPAIDHERLPIHVLSLVHLGLHLAHNLALEELAEQLAIRNRSDFMLVVAPLRIPHGTGCPISPVAIV